MARATASGAVRIVALGGIGEIGRNCMVVEYGDEAIVVDCGLTFPDVEMFGVDLVIPDFSYLREIRHKLRAFVLTHGHEDHIGALPFALKEFRLPLYGSRLTMGLVRVKLDEYLNVDDLEIHEVAMRETVAIGPFRCEFVHMCHSIPDASAIAIHTPIGTIMHTGDFKLDHTPVDGIPPDFQSLGRIGADGVLLLLADSTYADRAGYTPSEHVVGETLDKIFSEAPGRIILATFSSLISRVQQVIDAAYAYGRQVCIVGRSMERTFKVAVDLGYLKIPDPDMVIAPDKLDQYPAERVAIVSTGSQGEPRSALVRMANRDHRQIEIRPDDTVIVSATAIPGNEFQVNRTIDRLARLGARVIYEQLAPVHVSGHASQEELKYMHNTLRPRFFMPIHGEYRHLIEHSRLAQRVGLDPEHILIAENGTIVEVSEDDFQIVGETEAGNVFVDGAGVGDVGSAVLRDPTSPLRGRRCGRGRHGRPTHWKIAGRAGYHLTRVCLRTGIGRPARRCPRTRATGDRRGRPSGAGSRVSAEQDPDDPREAPVSGDPAAAGDLTDRHRGLNVRRPRAVGEGGPPVTRRRPATTARSSSLTIDRWDVLGFLGFVVAALGALALVGQFSRDGLVVAAVGAAANEIVGRAAPITAIVALVLGSAALIAGARHRPVVRWSHVVAALLFVVSLAALAALASQDLQQSAEDAGGWVGQGIGRGLEVSVGLGPAYMFLGLLAVGSLAYAITASPWGIAAIGMAGRTVIAGAGLAAPQPSPPGHRHEHTRRPTVPAATRRGRRAAGAVGHRAFNSGART